MRRETQMSGKKVTTRVSGTIGRIFKRGVVVLIFQTRFRIRHVVSAAMRQYDNASENEEWRKQHDQNPMPKGFGSTRPGSRRILIAHSATLRIKRRRRSNHRGGRQPIFQRLNQGFS